MNCYAICFVIHQTMFRTNKSITVFYVRSRFVFFLYIRMQLIENRVFNWEDNRKNREQNENGQRQRIHVKS